MRLFEYLALSLRRIGLPPFSMPRFICALVVFVIAAVLLEPIFKAIQNPYEYPVHSWSWWTVKTMRERQSSPNIVLLGSSLMVVANAESDATWYGKRLDLTTYRQSRYFDDQLEARAPVTDSCSPNFARHPLTINLSSPGQIPSDAYLTLKSALREGVRPELVVYGVAPRDFLDSTMSSPLDSECFRYLGRIVPTEDLLGGLCLDPLELFGRKLLELPFARSSLDFQMWLNKQAGQIVDRMIGGCRANTLSLAERMILLKDYEPLDMVPGFVHAEVADRSMVERQYEENLEDYVARYMKPRESFYKGQISSFEKLIALVKSEGIRLVVVNMPIRQCNARLLEGGLFERYRKDLKRVCSDNKVAFKDLCDFEEYGRSDFRDSVHLNAFGGMRFIKHLDDFIVSVFQQENSTRRVAGEHPIPTGIISNRKPVY